MILTDWAKNGDREIGENRQKKNEQIEIDGIGKKRKTHTRYQQALRVQKSIYILSGVCVFAFKCVSHVCILEAWPQICFHLNFFFALSLSLVRQSCVAHIIVNSTVFICCIICRHRSDRNESVWLESHRIEIKRIQSRFASFYTCLLCSNYV